jgi:hypothetical protein
LLFLAEVVAFSGIIALLFGYAVWARGARLRTVHRAKIGETVGPEIGRL